MSAIERIIRLLHEQTGHNFSLYKPSSLLRRVERRMDLHRISRATDYVRLLEQSPCETELLFKELLIGVTSFFRDPHAWEFLRQQAIPGLLAERPDGAKLRAWTPGCSTGEEAYTLAIVFREALEQIRPRGGHSLRIFATDLNQDAIDQARSGLYPVEIEASVSAERLQRFFIRQQDGYRISPEIRDMVVFSPKNIIMDSPFTKLDLLTCRNLLIYLAPELQKKLLPLFHYSLNAGGILFLGSAETVGDFTSHFEPLDRKSRIFRRIESPLEDDPIEFPILFPTDSPWMPVAQTANRRTPNLQALANQLFLARYAPAATLTNDQGDILYLRGRTDRYLIPPAGKTYWNLFAMAREGLGGQLSAAFRQAEATRSEATLAVSLPDGAGGEQRVVVKVQRLTEPEPLRGMMLTTFTEPAAAEINAAGITAVPPGAPPAHPRRHHLQHSFEELITLQEDIESMDEELRERMDHFSALHMEMDRLLLETDVAMLFLDEDLRVRRFTDPVLRFVALTPADVGRPLNAITPLGLYPEFTADLCESMRSRRFLHREVSTPAGDRVAIRIAPHAVDESRIDGVSVTLGVIPSGSASAASTREALRLPPRPAAALPATGPGVIALSPPGLLLIDERGVIQKADAGAASLLGCARTRLETQRLERFIHPEALEAYALCQERLLEERKEQQCELRLVRDDGTTFWGRLSLPPPGNSSAEPCWPVAINDITPIRQAEEKLRLGIERYIACFEQCCMSFSFFEIGLHTPVATALPLDDQLETIYRTGTIRGCNRTLAVNRGFTNPSEMIGAKLGQLFPRLAPGNVACLRGFIEGGYNISGAETAEPGKDGRIRHFSNSLVGIVENGFLIKILGAKQDISWLKRTRPAASG